MDVKVFAVAEGGHMGPPLQENCRLTATWYEGAERPNNLKHIKEIRDSSFRCASFRMTEKETFAGFQLGNPIFRPSSGFAGPRPKAARPSPSRSFAAKGVPKQSLGTY